MKFLNVSKSGFGKPPPNVRQGPLSLLKSKSGFKAPSNVR
jgi:hypothetical protein